jgi:hypothetical protein
MEGLEKVNCFQKELQVIRNNVIKEFVVNSISSMPDYFFTMSASTTGKYHPAYSQGEGGVAQAYQGYD